MSLSVRTPEQVAELVQVHPRTVMRAIMAGDLDAAQLARRGCWRITDEAIEAWIELRSNRHRPPVQPELKPVDLAVPDKQRVHRSRSRRGPQTGRLELPPSGRKVA